MYGAFIADPILALAVVKSATSVQDDPLYCSVLPTGALADGAYPPNPKAAVYIPDPAIFSLEVFKVPPADQAPIG